MGLFETQLKRLHVCNLSNPFACGLGIQGYNTLRRQGISISRLLEDLSCLFTYQIRPNVRSPSEEVGAWDMTGSVRPMVYPFRWVPIKHVPRGNKMPEWSVAFVEQFPDVRCPCCRDCFSERGVVSAKKNGDIYIYSLDTMDGFMFFLRSQQAV